MANASVRFSNRGFNLKSFRPLGLALLALAPLAVRGVQPPPQQPAYFHSGVLDHNTRVWAQAQIERVFYNHRIWPATNPTPKPAFEAVVTTAMLSDQVSEYMGQANALDQAGLGISAEILQNEIDRMISTSQDPAVLKELFDALDTDPFLVAEIIALQNLVRALYPAALAAGSVSGPANSQNPGFLAPQNRPVFTISAINASVCASWNPTRSKPPEARESASAVWTGSEMIVWGGNFLNSGARYNPAIDSWVPIAVSTAAPSSRRYFTAVWTGMEMIIWGGETSLSVKLNTGARYNPDNDTWQPTCDNLSPATMCAAGSDAPPSARARHTAVWTGSEMIIWGGADTGYFQSGGRYTPGTDSWQSTSISAPDARADHSAVWTGSEMIVWGGINFSGILNSGGRYTPGTPGTWTPTRESTTGNCSIPNNSVPTCRNLHTAVWTGTRMVIWGGNTGFATGGVYNPAMNAWTTLPAAPANTGWTGHTAVWTGETGNAGSRNRMIIWGGHSGSSQVNTGSIYDPAAGTNGSWSVASTTGAPVGRDNHVAVWSGRQMIVWGGQTGILANTGGRYNPASNNWLPTYLGANIPTARAGHTAVWTGSEMIVWSGSSGSPAPPGQTGARYFPAINEWSPTSQSTTDCPVCPTCASCRPTTTSGGHTAIWNGSHMMIWGGKKPRPSDGALDSVNTGGQYNPSTNQWDLPISLNDQEFTVPNTRPSGCTTASGTKVACPFDDPCFPNLSLSSNIPAARDAHTAVKNDKNSNTQMIVFGGENTDGGMRTLLYNSWGRYDWVDDSWACKPAGVIPNIPAERIYHTAVWDDSNGKMIVWGGNCEDIEFPPGTVIFSCASDTPREGDKVSGGRFTPGIPPIDDLWTATDTASSPANRQRHTAVWDDSGQKMIVWGGVNTGGASLVLFKDGGRYSPGGSWTPTDTASPDLPTARYDHTAIWTGTTAVAGSSNEMIIWGGIGCEDSSCSTGNNHFLGTGALYAPSGSDSWDITPVGGFSPSPRTLHTAVWTRDSGPPKTTDRMIIWGGSGANGDVNTGSAYSPLGFFIIDQPQPAIQSVCPGDTVTYDVNASPGVGLNYQWRKDGAAVGSNSSTLTLDPVGCTDGGSYDVEITGLCGFQTSAAAVLNVTPIFISGPTLIYDCSPLNLQLSVAINTNCANSWQWQKFTGSDFVDLVDNGATDNTMIRGAKTSLLTMGDRVAAGEYRVQNSCRTFTSSSIVADRPRDVCQ